MTSPITPTIGDYGRMKAALQECEAYFEERADAEYFPDSAGAVGNAEMRLLVEIRDALEALVRQEK